MDRFATYDFLTFHSNQGRISCRFRDILQFQSNIAKFSHPFLFCVPAEGVPLGTAVPGLGGQKTRMMGLPGNKEV